MPDDAVKPEMRDVAAARRKYRECRRMTGQLQFQLKIAKEEEETALVEYLKTIDDAVDGRQSLPGFDEAPAPDGEAASGKAKRKAKA